jgi:hypothetical protein
MVGGMAGRPLRLYRFHGTKPIEMSRQKFHEVCGPCHALHQLNDVIE